MLCLRSAITISRNHVSKSYASAHGTQAWRGGGGGGGGMTNFLVMNKTIYAWLNRFLTLKETLNRLFVEKVWCEAEYLHNVHSD